MSSKSKTVKSDPMKDVQSILSNILNNMEHSKKTKTSDKSIDKVKANKKRLSKKRKVEEADERPTLSKKRSKLQESTGEGTIDHVEPEDIKQKKEPKKSSKKSKTTTKEQKPKEISTKVFDKSQLNEEFFENDGKDELVDEKDVDKIFKQLEEFKRSKKAQEKKKQKEAKKAEQKDPKRKYTDDGLPIYTIEELGITDNGGGKNYLFRVLC